MPKFPAKEIDILALATQMMAGYSAHGGDFPSVSGPGLLIRKRNYEDARDAQIQAQAALRLATEEKLTCLDMLKKEIKQRLAKSEVDVSGDPEKLSYLGWGPRQQPQPVGAPTAPRNLCTIAEGQTKLRLKWDRPVCGGAVRNYIVQRRRQPQGGGEFGSWEITATALENEIKLKNQPRGIQMEYRVKAANVTDESTPSNVAAVVL